MAKGERFCRDCQYFYPAERGCMHSEVQRIVRAVMGPAPQGKPITALPAFVTRASGELCGREGSWFEPAEGLRALPSPIPYARDEEDDD
jgi:hypothetical protein